ncbi:MAG TPA: hypothetical protein VEJ63_13620 [Planctomycetota bacterium]|nr:hypothetical protein [Planctomycetota bacterium]
MVSSLLKLKVPFHLGIHRFRKWLRKPLIKRSKVKSLNAVDCACTKEGEWRGLALQAWEQNGWTVFDELSGGLLTFQPEDFKRLAENDSLMFFGYNDSVPYGHVLCIEKGQIVRDFLDDETEPSVNRNVGRLQKEKKRRMKSWVDVEFHFSDEIIDHVAPDVSDLLIFEWSFKSS